LDTNQISSLLDVKTIVVGHKPHMDSPMVIKNPDDVYIISTDTSYSKMKAARHFKWQYSKHDED
jgi:hypothetical protein